MNAAHDGQIYIRDVTNPLAYALVARCNLYNWSPLTPSVTLSSSGGWPSWEGGKNTKKPTTASWAGARPSSGIVTAVSVTL